GHRCLGRLVFFFFQAEDGIRDYKVTGVQTCALPISIPLLSGWGDNALSDPTRNQLSPQPLRSGIASIRSRTCGGLPWRLTTHVRSEERRVGKECRGRWWG